MSGYATKIWSSADGLTPTLTQLSDAQLLSLLQNFLGSITGGGTATLDSNGNATITDANVLSTSRIVIFPASGNSNTPLFVIKSAGVGFTISSPQGGALDAGVVIDYIIKY